MNWNAEETEEAEERGAEEGCVMTSSSHSRLHVRAEVPDAWNKVTEQIIGCAMEVHSVLGPGMLERLYEDALAYELREKGLEGKRQCSVRVQYKSIRLSEQRLDLVVDDLVVVELKSIERVPEIHLAQLVSYLRSAGLPLGLLINFNTAHLRNGIYRRINPRALPARPSAVNASLRSSDPSVSSAFPKEHDAPH